MANEATLIIETGSPIPFTVANGNGLEKGTILKLTDPMTASGALAYGNPIAGISASEKIASDGKTRLACFRQGIFKGTASGSITAGQAITITTSNSNILEACAVNTENTVGIALETAANTETFLFELRPTAMELA